MKGGVILFRGTGAAACRYLESDRSRADDYYLEDGATLAPHRDQRDGRDPCERITGRRGVCRMGGLGRPADQRLDGQATTAR